MVEEEIRQGTEGGENTQAVRRAATGRNTNKEHQESTRKARTARETPVVSGTEAACVYMCAYSVFSAGKKKKKKTTLEYREQNLLLLLDSGRARRSQTLQTTSVNQQDCLQEIPACHRFPPSTDDPKYWLIALVERRKRSGRGQQLCISWNRADEKKIYIFIYFKDPGKEPKRKVLSQGLAVFRQCRARLFFFFSPCSS